MLCPSNPAEISETYNQLLTLTDPIACGGVTRSVMLGGVAMALPDGSMGSPPCRTLLEDATMLPGSSERRELIEKKIFAEFYNTNYTASWTLVRSGVVLTRDGNLEGCVCADLTDGTASRRSTLGPLSPKLVGASRRPASIIPLLACGGPGAPLGTNVDEVSAGAPTARSFTRGPVLTQEHRRHRGRRSFRPVRSRPPAGEPDDPDTPGGRVCRHADGGPRRRRMVRHLELHAARLPPFWAGASRMLQYPFRPTGSVRSFRDTSKDRTLNNGFPAMPDDGFSDDAIELPAEDVFSGWDLRAK